MSESAAARAPSAGIGEKIRAHVSIARPDHWIKNVFMLPGLAVPISVDPSLANEAMLLRLLAGGVSICLIASSNYVINELLDAPYDRIHPDKKFRPFARGAVSARAGYLQWLILMAAGMGMAWIAGAPFTIVMAALWLMGVVYNVPPVRSKDLPFLDVLSEAVNNPLRMLAGWFIADRTMIAPASLLLSYWMVGCYFMALKRFSELRELRPPRAAAYRRSFRYYTEVSLLVSVMFYASAAMLFLGAFITRYRIEFVLAFPLVALVMALYCRLAFNPRSSVQHPERLYTEKPLMAAVSACAIVMIALLFYDIPVLDRLLAPTLPVGR